MLSIPPGRNPALALAVRNRRARRPIRRRSVLHPGEARRCGQLRVQAPEETSGIFAMATPRGLGTRRGPLSRGFASRGDKGDAIVTSIAATARAGAVDGTISACEVRFLRTR